MTIHILRNFYNKNNIYYNYILQFKFVNVLDILSKIYNKDVKESEVDEELYNEYMSLSNYQHIYYKYLFFWKIVYIFVYI